MFLVTKDSKGCVAVGAGEMAADAEGEPFKAVAMHGKKEVTLFSGITDRADDAGLLAWAKAAHGASAILFEDGSLG